MDYKGDYYRGVMKFLANNTSKKGKPSIAVIIILSVFISIIGIIVQMEWGKALSQGTVKNELIENTLLLFMGLGLCGLLLWMANKRGKKAALNFITMLAVLLLVLTCTPLSTAENGIRLLHIGPIVIRYILIVPLAYVLAVSHIIAIYVAQDEYKMFLSVTAITFLFLMTASLFDYAERLWYLLPAIAYCLMFPYMKKHVWYLLLPGVFILLFTARIIYVWIQPEGNIFLFRDRVIYAWLHPASEKFTGENYFRNEIWTMIKSAGLWGNRNAMAADNISYLQGSDLLLIGVVQRFGYAGFTAVVLLYTEMCRRICKKGSTLTRSGNLCQGAVCRGIGIYLSISAILSVISQFYLLPLIGFFSTPFLCVSGFQPIWYLFLSAALLMPDEFDERIGSSNREERTSLTEAHIQLKRKFVIHILPIKGLESSTIEHRDKSALIACSSRTDRLKRAVFSNNFCAVSFADVSSPDQHNAMREGHALLIRDFVLSLKDEITDLYICCDSAESRSPAIAAAILTVYGFSDDCVWKNPFYAPNVLVYQRICNAFGVNITKRLIDKKMHINEQAYRFAQERHGSSSFSRWQTIDMNTLEIKMKQ